MTRTHSVVLLAVAALMIGRPDRPLLEPEETRYAEIPREMLAEGRFVVPVWHGETYLHKPPLFYWLVMLSYSIFGVHDWAARLVPALSGVLTVAVGYLWLRRAVGSRVALFGVLMLGLAGGFAYRGTMLTLDGLLGLWVLAALACGHTALAVSPTSNCSRMKWWLLAGVCCGLGVLTKGPVAVVLVGLPLAVGCWFDRAMIRPSWREWVAFGAVVAAVAGPWFALVAQAEPVAAYEFFWLHNVRRYADAFDHQQPAWYYLPEIALDLLPGALVLLPLVGTLLRAGAVPGLARFMLLAVGWGLLFFSLSSCKRPGYVVPLIPPLALALGVVLANASGLRRWLAPAGGVAFAALFVCEFVGLPWYSDRFSLRTAVCECTNAPDAPIFCYPHEWDSVRFYLGRGDVAVFAPGRSNELAAALLGRPRVVLFVKSSYLSELQAALPPELVFVPTAVQNWLTVGEIRRR
jgi:4-amino-4-deoxy-L-arabinose transferase-like glycosyltransferase